MNQLITIPTQTGVCSYNISLEASQTVNSAATGNYFLVGFTGQTDSNTFVGFRGKNGMLYDIEGNFFGSYQPGNPFNLSGYIYPNYYNYFLNGNLKNTNCNRPTGYLEGYYINTGNSIYNTNINIFGNPGYVYVSGGTISSGQITGSLVTINTSPSGIVRYQFLSGQITAGNWIVNIDNSGWINGEYNFPLLTTQPTSTTGYYPITGTFYTNFGQFTTGVQVYVAYDLSLILSLFGFSLGGSGVTGTGTLNYSEQVGAQIVNGPIVPISIMLKNSGIVSDTNPQLNQNITNLLLTGATTQPNPTLHFSGGITGSGYLSSMDSFQCTGTNYYLASLGYPSNNTGTMYATNMLSVYAFASGTYNIPWQTIGSGLATGYALLLLPLTGGISGSFPYQFNISGSGMAYFISGINGTGYSNTFQSLAYSLFSGTGYSPVTIAYATGSGYFSYTGNSTGNYIIPTTGLTIFGGQTTATGIAVFTSGITGTQDFSNHNWLALYQLTSAYGTTQTFSATLSTGTAYFTGLYSGNSGEMYATGMISGVGYTGAGFIYSSGFYNSGNWIIADSGSTKYLVNNFGYHTGTPLYAINTGTIYTGDFNTTGVSATIVTGQSGFILISNIGAPTVNSIPPIFISGGTNVLNYLNNCLWVKHTNHLNGTYVYSITRYKGLTSTGLNQNIDIGGFVGNMVLNEFLCKKTDLAHFATGFYDVGGDGTYIISNVFAQGYSTTFEDHSYDTGIYIRIGAANVSPEPNSGVFMFSWQSGDSITAPYINLSGQQYQTITGQNYLTGYNFSGVTFAQELPTGTLNAFYATYTFSTGTTGSYVFYPRVTGTQLTGIGTGNYQSGYINYPFNFTGTTGTLNDILIDATGYVVKKEFVTDASNFYYPNTYQIGFYPAYFPVPVLTGGINYIDSPNGVVNSINTNYNAYGFSGFLTGANLIGIDYTGQFTGQEQIFVSNIAGDFSGSFSGMGIGTKINSNLVTGRNIVYTPNITGYSLWTGLVNIYPYLTGWNMGYYSGTLTANAPISGIVLNGTIYGGSGIYTFGIQTGTASGTPYYGFLTTSGMMPITPFSGYPLPFIGTGFYTTGASGTPTTYPTGLFYGIGYVETFSGEYTFYTGLNYSQMNKVAFLSPSSGFSGMANISGSGNIYYTIGKNFGITGDTLILTASGYINSIAQQIIQTN